MSCHTSNGTIRRLHFMALLAAITEIEKMKVYSVLMVSVKHRILTPMLRLRKMALKSTANELVFYWTQRGGIVGALGSHQRTNCKMYISEDGSENIACVSSLIIFN